MKATVLLLIGAAIGVLVAINVFPGRRPGPLGNTTLMVKTGGDTVTITSKSDTIVINAMKDTIIINGVYSEYCNRIPRPKDCPPLKVDTIVVKR
jgi:hypothetical protein